MLFFVCFFSGKSSFFNKVLVGLDPGPAWYCVSPAPFMGRCLSVGPFKPPSLFVPLKRDYARNAGNLTDPGQSRRGFCPLTFWDQGLSETGHRLTTPPWERTGMYFQERTPRAVADKCLGFFRILLNTLPSLFTCFKKEEPKSFINPLPGHFHVFSHFSTLFTFPRPFYLSAFYDEVLIK